MPPLSYARAVSRPEAPFTFRYVEDIPTPFRLADPALLALSTSGQVNEYKRTDRLKVENKSQSATIKDLTKRLGDVEKKLEENSKKIMNWQVAAQAVEAYAILLWQEPLAIPKSTKVHLRKLHINNVLQLRFQSQLHHNDDERDDITQSASDAYNKIPIHYRNVLDQLIRNKARCAVDRAIIAHPTICKSQIVMFLASHFTQQNAATDLLIKVPSLEVLDSDGTYVSMFQEG